MHDVTLVFDLDGTLVDTAPDLVGAANHVLTGLALAPLPAAALQPWISFGARRMIVEALASHGVTRDEATIDLLLASFLDHYVANIAAASRPFPGAVAALDRLLARGATLAVCTNKRHALAVQLLDALALSPRFGAIAGRDTFPVSKPHPDHLLGAVAMAGGDPARTVLIGDSAVDVATARAARVPIVGVSFGYTDTPMHALRPDALIDHYDQLDAALAPLLALT